MRCRRRSSTASAALKACACWRAVSAASGDFDLAEDATAGRVREGARGPWPAAGHPRGAGRMAHDRRAKARHRSAAPADAGAALGTSRPRSRRPRTPDAPAPTPRPVGPRRPAAPGVHLLPSRPRPPAQVALALRTLCGLSTREIARAFLEPEATTRSGWCARRARSARPASPTRCRRGSCCPSGWTPCSASSTWSSTRATPHRGGCLGARRSGGRRSALGGCWWS